MNITKWSEDYRVKLSVGMILCVTSLIELYDSLFEKIQAEHGLLVFSIWHILKTLPEFQHAADEINTAKRK